MPTGFDLNAYIEEGHVDFLLGNSIELELQIDEEVAIHFAGVETDKGSAIENVGQRPEPVYSDCQGYRVITLVAVGVRGSDRGLEAGIVTAGVWGEDGADGRKVSAKNPPLIMITVMIGGGRN